ncbi:uncharacterized protein BBOV_IV003580 [Babesia bovis T2Bo]|uniref:Uncharacterized protein n=1 Tax=Babesia bovis TaxID=5865 RepID=A7AVX8_BABBO|nr:uncharacterized protein BBOV_IV003580 [Babesia bovis T2Bo]EDO05954.1 hypothetical protein BBOV_IV003580 [Babesia bovis T2Bo]|eukprot:XP_001609522.1 hypothetical protein [Babesia bovis T2Bo]
MSYSRWPTTSPVSGISAATSSYDPMVIPTNDATTAAMLQRTMQKNSDRSHPAEGSMSILQRYNGALEMLRNRLWNSTAKGNLSFEEPDDGEPTSSELPWNDGDDSHIISVERDLSVRSALRLKHLLQSGNTVPSAVLDAVLSHDKVVHRLRSLNDIFTFGKRLYLPEEEMDINVINAIRTALPLFNGSCVPLVMWPSTDPSLHDNERVRIEESTVFEALQIYCLHKHNREVYIERSRSSASMNESSGSLAIDMTDVVVVREISDTILDELLATLWTLGYLALQMHPVGSDQLRPYACAILSNPEEIVSRLWKMYLSFTEHLKLRFLHIKDVDVSLKDNLHGRLIVEAHRVAILQCAIVKTLLDIHIGTRNMTLEEYQRYATHFESRNFTGAFAIVRNVMGDDDSKGSQLLNHAIHELQALGTMLLSSFFLYRGFGADKISSCDNSFVSEATTYMYSQLTLMDNGDTNKSRAMLIFAFTGFLKNLSIGDSACNADLQFIEKASAHLESYVSSLEWLALSRDCFGRSNCSPSATITQFPCRLLLLESIASVIDIFGVKRVPHLESVVNALCIVVDRDNTPDLAYQATKLSLMERIGEYLMSNFPFGLSSLFQLFGAFLPFCGSHVDDENIVDIDNDHTSMDIVVRILLSKFDSIVISPLTSPVEYKSDTGEIEVTEDIYLDVQLLQMLGLDKRLLLDKWFSWEMSNSICVIRAGIMGKPVLVNDLRNLSWNATASPLGDDQDLWVVDADVSTSTSNGNISALWMQEASLENTGVNKSGLRGCHFELNDAITFEIYSNSGNAKSQKNMTGHFTLLRALWLVWRGCIMYIVHTGRELPHQALGTFVTVNSLLTGIISRFPRLISMIEDHINVTFCMNESNSRYPFGPSSIIFHYTLLYLVCLKHLQLHVMLPEVIDAIRSFLQPTYVIPVGENVTEVEFHRYWIFLQSLESCSQFLTDDHGLSMFAFLERILHEEERPLRTYPVTRGILKFFKELLIQCPPELWMLSAWHHGMLNMSHTSLEMESSNVTHGLDLSYLNNLRRHVHVNAHKSNDLYNPFQSQLLCEMFGYVLKTVFHAINDFEFADSAERFCMVEDIAEIAQLTCGIFRVYNYDNGKPFSAASDSQVPEDHWAQGLNELINRILLILSGSSYIMGVVNALTFQMDLLKYHQGPLGASLVMVNPLKFSEMSLSFFTLRSILHRRMGVVMLSSTKDLGFYASQCKLNYRYRWLRFHENTSLMGQSKRILAVKLKFLRNLYVIALPKNRNPLFNTLAETLGSPLFLRCRNGTDHRGKFITSHDQLLDPKDPVVYFSRHQMDLLRASLPQASVVTSIVFHTYTTGFASTATDILSLYLLLSDQFKLQRGVYNESTVDNSRIMLNQLANTRGHYDIISHTDKDEICFYEHLISVCLDGRKRSYELRVSIMQYLNVALSTCSGMEMLWDNNGVDVKALLDFVDSMLRLHLLHGHGHSLGDVTIAQHALLILPRLIELSKGTQNYCWETITFSLNVLIELWRSFDSNLFLDADTTFYQQGAAPRSTMAKESWFDKVVPDLNVHMSDSLVERRLGLLRIMGAVYAILDSLNAYLLHSKLRSTDPPDEFLHLLSSVSMNWEFMDTLFPIVFYDSGFIHSYVKNDVTERKMGHYYRLGLWLGEDCLDPLSRLLHHLYDMKISHHHLLMQGDSLYGVEPFDITSMLGRLNRCNSQAPHKKIDNLISSNRLNINRYANMLGEMVGPSESNALKSRKYELTSGATAVMPSDPGFHTPFYTFGTAYEFGHNYLVDVEKFHHLSVILITSSDDKANVLYSEGMGIVRRHIELIPYIESLNDLKVMLLRQLCNLVTNFRSQKPAIYSRMRGLLDNDVATRDNANIAIGNHMEPFKMYVFNVAMMLHFIMTLPSCLSEHPLYIGLFIDLLHLILEGGLDIMELEPSFSNYYECYRSSHQSDESGSDLGISQDGSNVTKGCDKDKVAQEFRSFALNVFSGLLVQISHYILEFSRHFYNVLDVDFRPKTSYRRSLRVRVAALSSCVGPGELFSAEEEGMYIGDASSSGNRECVCKTIVGKTVVLCNATVWLHFMLCSFFNSMYRITSSVAKACYKAEPRDIDDGAIECHQRMTTYASKALYDTCIKKIDALRTANDRLLQCFADAGCNTLRSTEVESAFVFIMGPYSSLLTLQSIVLSDINSDYTKDVCYPYVVQLVDALTKLPYSTSACISPSIVKYGDFVNSSVLTKCDKMYMAECLRGMSKGLIRYENCNWLRTLLYKLFERFNVILLHGISSMSVLNGFIECQLIQRLYLYSFLCQFVQPLQHVNPKSLLSNFSAHTLDGTVGNCLEVMESNVATWYPAYQVYSDGEAVRCPYHLLHCGLLRFVSELCSYHSSTNAMKNSNMESMSTVMPLLLSVVHLLRQRCMHVLTSDLTLATMEECYVIFTILRQICSWRRLPDSDSALMPELLRCSMQYCSNLIQAFQNGLDKIYDQIPPKTVDEGILSTKHGLETKVSSGNKSPDALTMNNSRQVYRQRCLYLALKTVESFITFLLNTDITLGCVNQLPPTLEAFLKSGDPANCRRMCGVDRVVFQSVLRGQPVSKPVLCTRDDMSKAGPNDPTFELMCDALGTCVDLYLWSLRVYRELRGSSKEPFLLGFRQDAEGGVHVALSLYSTLGGDYFRNGVDSIDCLVYENVSVRAHNHVDVVPSQVPLVEFQSLFGCVIEKSALFCASAVNTIFLQNQLYTHDESRSRGLIDGRTKVIPSSGLNNNYIGLLQPSSSRLHSTLTLLHNAFSEVASKSTYLSDSTVEFCKMLGEQIDTRIVQSKMLYDVFGDSYVYLER